MKLFRWRPGRSTVPQGGGTTSARWVPTHRHSKGGLYRLLCTATNEADRTPVAVYDDADGAVWVRSAAEFNDGRFQLLPKSAQTP